MNWGLFAVAVMCAAGGGACLYFRRSYGREIALMAATQTSRAADVAGLPAGSLVEVKGTIRCAQPFNAQFSGRACVYSRSKVERRERRQRDGRTETHYVTESDVENRVLFDVEDESGRVSVDSAGASVEAPEVYNQDANTGVGQIAAIAADLLGGTSMRYRHRENILAPDVPIYVLGTVQPGGRIGAAPPNASARDFIVTHESEEQRTSSSHTTMIILAVLAGLLFVGAAVAIYFALKS